MHTLEEINTSPLCVLCMILFLTLTLVHTCYEKSTPRSIGQRKISTLKNIKFYLIKGIFPLGILTITHVWSRNLKRYGDGSNEDGRSTQMVLWSQR